jgi:hypothetical protein
MDSRVPSDGLGGDGTGAEELRNAMHGGEPDRWDGGGIPCRGGVSES